MNASTVPADSKRKWYGLAQRHLRMASRLLASGFADGAYFHIYHAYECSVSAFIAAHGVAVPPDGVTVLTAPRGKRVYLSLISGRQESSTHKARIMFFNELADPTMPYARLHARLRRLMTDRSRNDALYYDTGRGLLPQQRYDYLSVSAQWSIVRQFCREVWRDIR